jgi:hypothetical protein
LLLISLSVRVTLVEPAKEENPYSALPVRQLLDTTSPDPMPTPAPVLSSMVLYSMVQSAPPSWLTVIWPSGATKFSTVRYSIVTFEGAVANADWFTPSPLRMAPGAPMITSPAWGSMCPYSPSKVWTPGANQ